MHGSEELPVVIGEFSGDVFRAHLFKDVSRALLWTLLLFQGRLGETKENLKKRKLDWSLMAV